jgi:hypothetical protein
VLLLIAPIAQASPLRSDEPGPPAAAGTVVADTTPPAPADTTPPARPDTTPPARADTTPPAGRDTAAADTTKAASDTTGAAADTATAAQLAQMREGLAGGSFPKRDSVFQGLMARKGFRIVEYRGRRVSLQVPDRIIRLEDSAQANYGDAALQADSITYRSRLAFLAARGHLLLMSPDQRQVKSDSVLYYDVSRRKGTVMDARTQFAAQGADWIVNGNAVPVGTDTLFVSKGQFTTCDLDHPHYWFQAGQIKMVNQDVIVAWPVTLYIEHVPVFWLPFFAQDIRPNRRSGILPPQFGINDIVRTGRGYSRNIRDFGYYWAINRFMDAKFTVDWYSGQYTQLNGTYRYNDIKKHFSGNVQASEQFGKTGRNLRLNLTHQQDLSPGTHLDVSAQYVQSPGTYLRRSFDPNQQTQTIDSNVSLRKQLSWVNLTLGARRRQFLGPNSQLQYTLPSLSASFPSVTLFRAPSDRAGFFNNLVWSSALNFQRQTQSVKFGTDTRQTTASANQSLLLHGFNLQASANYNDQLRTPADSLGNSLPAFSQTALTWNASADYQVGLMGSTTLRPTVSVSGGQFRSLDRGDSIPDTRGQFLTSPARASFGATLSTDLYAFFPGFGPFTRIRHKISPRFTWSYSPAVSTPDSLSQIPGFPGGSSDPQNRLSISISQTFEAKVRTPAPETPSDTAGRSTAPGDTTGVAVAGAAADTSMTAAPAADTSAAPGSTLAGASVQGGAPAPVSAVRERKIMLLAIQTSTPLVFDFAASARGQPVLQTETITNSFSSDLLRGFSLNMTHDLFKGTGPDRTFSLFLTRLNASFTISSGMSLGSLVGLGSGGGSRPPPPRTQRSPEGGGRQERRGGPWSLSLSYSLNRYRPGEFGTQNQTLQSNLSLQPTPNWRVQWRTSYNLTDHQFEEQQVSLVRTLHRWEARFDFTKSPNGNFLFDFQVSLTDVPQLHVNYDQRSGLSQ